MSKPWLVGFVEAEGSFFIVQKQIGRLVHSFGITQKLDRIVLESMRHILHIKTKVQHRVAQNSNNSYYKLETTNSRAILNIINYFANTMKGMKAVEYKIWARSFKDKKDLIKITKARDTLRNLRTIRANIPLWESNK
jgi:LAGLIDADG endonuclease